MQFIFTKLGSTFLIIILIIFGYFAYSALGGTSINITLKTNSTLEDGLIGHWTFDGKDRGGGGGTWYDDGYGYRRTITIAAGGTSGGAATTTTNGYAVLATTTLSTLMATSSGGNVEILDSNNNLPFDIIFTDDNDTDLLDFHFESYASTTGEIAAWIEVESISSTTPQTFHMYYGNSSATDVSDETGTWNATHLGVWHMAEDPSISTDGTCGGGDKEVCDSTSNNEDGDSNGSMTSSDQVTGQINGSIDFEGTDDYISATGFTWDSDMSMSIWLNPDASQSDGLLGSGAIFRPIMEQSGTSIFLKEHNGAYLAVSNTGLNTNSWNHAVITWPSTTSGDITFYINGVDVGISTDYGNTIPTGAAASTWIGRSLEVGYFNGTIDEARIYDNTIHAMDVLTDYNMGVDNTTFLSWGGEEAFSAGTATDVSGNGNTGTSVGGPEWVVGNTGQGLEFDGSDDVVKMPVDAMEVTSVTVSMWVNSATTGDEDRALSWDSGSANPYYIHVDGAGTKQILFKTNPSGGAVTLSEVVDIFGVWTHIVGTYDENTGNAFLYRDGVQVDSGSSSGAIAYTAFGEQRLLIGDDPDSTSYKGIIDDVRVYDRAISAEEVKRLYELGATTKINKTIATNPDLQTGLVGHWTFDGPDVNIGTNVVTDKSGSRNNGSTSGMDTSTTTAIGIIGQAFDFDGSDDAVNAGADNSLDPSSLTLTAWFKPSITSGTYTIAGKHGDSAGCAIGYALQVVSNKLRWVVDGSGCGNTTTIDSTTAVSADNWYFAVGTYDGTNGEVYLNAVSENQTTMTIGYNQDFYIGASYLFTSASLTTLFDGLIDDVRVYNRVLSQTEITRLYELGATTKINKTITTNPDLKSGLVGHWTMDGKDMYSNVADISGQGNHGALQGQTSTTTAIGVIGQALEFDGSDDYVLLPDDSVFNITGDMALSAWIKTSATSEDSIFGGGVYLGGGYYWYIGSVISGRPSFANGLAWVTADSTVNDDEWHHVAVTRSGTTITFFKDGILDGTQTLATPGSRSSSRVIGAKVDASSLFFTGQIDDVRLYNRALSQAEITRLYELGR